VPACGGSNLLMHSETYKPRHDTLKPASCLAGSLEEANRGHPPTRHSNQPVGGQSAGAVFRHLVPVLGEGGQRCEPEPELIVLTQNRRYEQWHDAVSARHHF